MPNAKNILLFAGTHLVHDQRVARSVRAFSRLGEIRAFYEDSPQNRKLAKSKSPFADRIRLIPLDFVSISRLKFPRTRKWVHHLRREIAAADIICIHDPGIVGLLLASYIKKKFRKTILFDYHDSIEYEYYYQLNKIHLKAKALKRVFTFFTGNLVKQVDGIVGISDRQIQQLLSYRKVDRPHIAIPNVRPSLEKNYSPRNNSLEFVWIGNVTRVNKIEDNIRRLNEFPNRDFHLILAGAIQDESYKRELESLAKFDVRFSGEFRTDEDIAKALEGRAICLIARADDPWETRMNEICSPNKAYSAINIGIPLLIDHKLEDLSSLLIRYGAGRTFRTTVDFFDAIRELDQSYETYLGNVRTMKRDINEKTIESQLLNFLNDFLHDRLP